MEDVLYALILGRTVGYATGGTLDRIGAMVGVVKPPGTAQEAWRALIYARITTNTSHGGHEALYTLLRLLGVDSALVRETFPAGVMPTPDLIPLAMPFVVAPIASALTKLAEKLPVFPYAGASRLGIVAALVLTSLVVRVALAWATGTIATLEWQAEVRLVLDAIAAAGLAVGGYAVVRADKPMLPP